MQAKNMKLNNTKPGGKVSKNQKIFTLEINPRWDEMDANGHINYMVYLSYFSEARLMALGQDVLMNLKKQNIGPFIYRTEVDYKKELRYPENIFINTWIGETIGKTRSIIDQEIYTVGSNSLVSKARFYATFVDLIRRRPVALPEALIERFF